MANKKGVVMFYDILEQLEDFNDKDFREIIEAVINYDKNGILPQFDGEKKIAFKFIKVDIDKNNEEYNKKCEQNRLNIAKRWNKENTTEYDRIQPNIDIDIDKDIDKDLDIDNKKENIKEKEIFDYWNSKPLIKHRELKDHLKAIQTALKENSIEEIKTCIDRYSIVNNDKNYYFNYDWTLTNFLKQKNAMKDFKDDGGKWISYQNRKQETTNYQPQIKKGDGSAYANLRER